MLDLRCSELGCEAGWGQLTLAHKGLEYRIPTKVTLFRLVLRLSNEIWFAQVLLPLLCRWIETYNISFTVAHMIWYIIDILYIIILCMILCVCAYAYSLYSIRIFVCIKQTFEVHSASSCSQPLHLSIEALLGSWSKCLCFTWRCSNFIFHSSCGGTAVLPSCRDTALADMTTKVPRTWPVLVCTGAVELMWDTRCLNATKAYHLSRITK